MTKFVVLTSFVMMMAGCVHPIEHSRAGTLIKHVGWYYDQCLVINTPDLSRGTVVTLIDAETTKNRFRSRIIALAKNADECPPLAEGRRSGNAEGGKSFYLISKPKVIGAEPAFYFGIAMVPDAENSLLPALETIDLNNDGIPDSFSYCATPEGIRFDVWSADPYKSKNLWDGYYYLGYDIDSNCPEI